MTKLLDHANHHRDLLLSFQRLGQEGLRFDQTYSSSRHTSHYTIPRHFRACRKVPNYLAASLQPGETFHQNFPCTRPFHPGHQHNRPVFQLDRRIPILPQLATDTHNLDSVHLASQETLAHHLRKHY